MGREEKPLSASKDVLLMEGLRWRWTLSVNVPIIYKSRPFTTLGVKVEDQYFSFSFSFFLPPAAFRGRQRRAPRYSWRFAPSGLVQKVGHCRSEIHCRSSGGTGTWVPTTSSAQRAVPGCSRSQAQQQTTTGLQGTFDSTLQHLVAMSRANTSARRRLSRISASPPLRVRVPSMLCP
jgi:hypothetical protein